VCSHLLLDLFLDLFEVGSQVHGHFVFGAQQGLKSRFLEFTDQVLNLYLQILNLQKRTVSLDNSQTIKTDRGMKENNQWIKNLFVTFGHF